ncbi:hypothetical protein TNIN_214081 [Trichonephila inaurata madagascariensis]|uniref:Uncharacterized protein n=1 Tax=Trichonephila inaurata madagascariensis TaxID=2747483 RepID=A0A8X6YGW0_9ARAC|nr:hypothetical protein TNIN_214081 [Trichonephila inaurata madagascariensis]
MKSDRHTDSEYLSNLLIMIIRYFIKYCTIHRRMLALPQEVGLQPVAPQKVFNFSSITRWKSMQTFIDPSPGEVPSRGYRLSRSTTNP